MTDVFLYADETGNLDFEGSGKTGSSEFFGFGTAIFNEEHSAELWDGHVLRSVLAGRGYNLAKGFHAKDDLWDIRNQMLALVNEQAPRVDTTFLLKENAYPSLKAQGEMRLYKMAWYLHLKYLCDFAVRRRDHLYVVIGSIGTKRQQRMAEEAVADVCSQMPQEITLCVWPASTAWGLQVADYALWAVHRNLTGRPLANYDTLVKPIVETIYFPWGR